MKSTNRKVQGILLVTLIAFFGLLGCEKIKDVAEFDILYTIPESEITVNSTTFELLGSEEVVLQQTVSINMDSIADEYSIEEVRDAKFEYIRLEGISPSGVSLSWIKELRIVASAPGIPDTPVASMPLQGTTGSVLDLDVKDVSIKRFLDEDSFTLKVIARGQPPLPADEITLLLKSQIRITVRPI
jgi:hypothetical protein